MSSRSWDFYRPAPRRAVQGGVVVARPGKVGDSVALELVEAATMESAQQILSRGRTYARAGQVVSVAVDSGAFSAQIQGTGTKPYRVRLERTTISGSDRVSADCSCPYGCEYGWCKHAAALAYVAAFMIDRDPSVRALWSGDDLDAATGVVAGLADDDLAVLRSEPPQREVAALMAAADAVVPAPTVLRGFGLGEGQGEG